MDEMIKILILKNRIEADLMEDILEENGIPYVLTCFHDNALDGIYEIQYGFGVIESYEQNEEAIRKLYAELTAGTEELLEKEGVMEKNDEEGENKVNRHFKVNLTIILNMLLKILIWILIIGAIFFFLKYLYDYREYRMRGSKYESQDHPGGRIFCNDFLHGIKDYF